MAEQEKPLLEFKNVSLRFGQTWALRNVSFTLGPGESRIIFGAAGSGKTMLLKAVVGLVPVDEGEVCLFGQNVRNLREQQLFGLRSRAGFLFQEGGLFDSMTIGENVAYPLYNRQFDPSAKDNYSRENSDGEDKAIEGKVRDALRFVELTHCRARSDYS